MIILVLVIHYKPHSHKCNIVSKIGHFLPPYSHLLIHFFNILAAKIAGLNHVELLNQSTAIAMAYRHEYSENTGSEQMGTYENVLVLAVGAQTTEVFVLITKT